MGSLLKEAGFEQKLNEFAVVRADFSGKGEAGWNSAHAAGQEPCEPGREIQIRNPSVSAEDRLIHKSSRFDFI